MIHLPEGLDKNSPPFYNSHFKRWNKIFFWWNIIFHRSIQPLSVSV